MKLTDAIRTAEKMVAEAKGEQAVALTVLVKLAKKVVRLQYPIRDLARALAPEARLDQQDLFKDDEKS